MTAGLDSLSPAQTRLVEAWVPGAVVVDDHSWGLVGTTVLQVRSRDDELFAVKAGDDADHHIAREIQAHELWIGPWTSRGRAPLLVAADLDAKVLVTRWLPGTLVQGDPSEHEVDTYRQAGELLAALHDQSAVEDDGAFERAQQAETFAWLDRSHRIAPDDVAALRDVVAGWPAPPSVVVPTHGDWQPRNWLVHEGEVRAIDFGRAALRPAATDLKRLAAQQFRGGPELERAFLDGYRHDPREPGAWLRTRIREAVSTAAWAYDVGDEAFERQGLRMVADVLAELAATT